MALHTNVRSRRARLKITQAQLGARIGWHKSQVSRLENGRVQPRIESLERIAKALRTTVRSLLR